MQFRYERGQQNQTIERSPDTGKVIWWKVPAGLTSQHWSSRQSRFVILVKLHDKRTEVVVDALGKAVRKLPTALRRSLTWDRGMELANHSSFTIATDVQVYFCDPQARGNAAATRTRTGCYGSTIQKERIFQGLAKLSWILSLEN